MQELLCQNEVVLDTYEHAFTRVLLSYQDHGVHPFVSDEEYVIDSEENVCDN